MMLLKISDWAVKILSDLRFLLINELPAENIKIFFELSIQLLRKLDISKNKKFLSFRNFNLFLKFDLKKDMLEFK